MEVTSSKFIPQFVPVWGDEERKAVQNVLEGDYLNEHKMVREFERKFAEFVGAKYCVTCTSGTIALYLAIKAVQEHWKESWLYVDVPDYAGIFVANASVQAGLRPVLADVEKNGSMLAHSTRSFVVHSNGRLGVARIIEDCCQAIHHHTESCISCYSFASTKHLTTAGQGGAVCCDDEEVFDKLCRLKDHGRNDRQKLKPMSDHFEQWGTNFKFMEVQAAFGLVQLQKLPRRLERLEEMYKLVWEELHNVKGIKFLDGAPKWYIDILVPDAQLMIQRLSKHNIQARRFYKSLHEQPLYSKKEFVEDKKFPNSEFLYNHGIWLPSTTNLTDEDIRYICGKIVESLSDA